MVIIVQLNVEIRIRGNVETESVDKSEENELIRIAFILCGTQQIYEFESFTICDHADKQSKVKHLIGLGGLVF